MAAPAMAGQGTRGGRIRHTDDERNAGLPWPIFASLGSTLCGSKCCKDPPEGRCPEARLSCATPLKDDPHPPAGLAHDNHASGHRRGASYLADTL